jgi:hypothetical protein
VPEAEFRKLVECKNATRRRFLDNWFHEHVVGIYREKVIVFDTEEATAR